MAGNSLGVCSVGLCNIACEGFFVYNTETQTSNNLRLYKLLKLK